MLAHSMAWMISLKRNIEPTAVESLLSAATPTPCSATSAVDIASQLVGQFTYAATSLLHPNLCCRHNARTTQIPHVPDHCTFAIRLPFSTMLRNLMNAGCSAAAATATAATAGGAGGASAPASSQLTQSPSVPDVSCTPEHCYHCFDAIAASLDGMHPPRPSFDATVTTPFFVTLKTADGELRGCIGTLSARSHSHLASYACKSAFEDRRFAPVASHELPSLTLGVSLLVCYEVAEHPEDWEVGVHGIILEFSAGGRDFSATYLPEVCSEQGWTRKEALLSLSRKAGWHKSSPPPTSTMRVTRYQSSKHTVTYAEWKAARSQAR